MDERQRTLQETELSKIFEIKPDQQRWFNNLLVAITEHMSADLTRALFDYIKNPDNLRTATHRFAEILTNGDSHGFLEFLKEICVDQEEQPVQDGIQPVQQETRKDIATGTTSSGICDSKTIGTPVWNKGPMNPQRTPYFQKSGQQDIRSQFGLIENPSVS